MTKFQEFLANTGMSMVSGAAQLLISDLLENIKEHNDKEPELIVEAVKAGDAFLKLLARAAAQTKTPIDDSAIAMFHNPVKAFAAQQGIDLTTVAPTTPAP